MAQSIVIGQVGSSTSTTLQATGTANGSSKAMALDRARAQAQTLLDALADSQTACPADCPVKTVVAEPDFDLGPPSYSLAPEASSVFICTVVQGRVITLTCAKGDPTGDPSANPTPGAA